MTPLPTATPDEKIDQMCDGSFPASDPPAVWTWEVTPVERPVEGPGGAESGSES